MTSASPRRARTESEARIVLLTSRWGGRDEASWAIRQVAGAIACSADVHVITTGGRAGRVLTDGVFEVHELGTADHASELRRELVCASLNEALCRGSQNGSGGGTTKEDLTSALGLYTELTKDLKDPWAAVSRLLAELGPDVIVLADYRQTGAVHAIEQGCEQVPLALVPLSVRASALEVELFRGVLERSGCAIVFSDVEREVFAKWGGEDWARLVGLPMGANPSVLREPNAHTGDSEYVLVLSRGCLDTEEGPALADQLLRTRFASMRVAISASDAFVVYDNAIKLHALAPLERRSDLLRLMAWARVTVDLHPGALFARHSVESLLYGTPIVVPGRSAARQHAQIGSGGLWFDSPADLVWCTEAVLDPANRSVLGTQGRDYAQRRYGSTESFIELTASAIDDVASGSVGRSKLRTPSTSNAGTS